MSTFLLLAVLELASPLTDGAVVSNEALATAAAADAKEPILPGWGRHFWNRKSVWYMYPPAFDFTNVANAVAYRFDIQNDRHDEISFTAAKPTESLKGVWDRIPARGLVTVACYGVDAAGRICGEAGAKRTFWKNPPFDPARCEPGVRPYAEAALGQYEYVFTLPHIQKMIDTGKLDYTYEHNCYPTKMNACLIASALHYGELKPSEKERAQKIACTAADCLIDLAEPEGAPLAGFTPTYAKDSKLHSAGRYAGQNMLCYPATAGSAFLTLYGATNDGKHLAAAKRIADTYLRLQGEDGTWYLKLWVKDGTPVNPNRLLPIGVCSFLLECSRVTGDAKYRAAADRAFAYVEKGPLANWNWEGQFEDVEPSKTYQNLTHHPPCEAALFLLERYPGDKARLAQARALLKFSEDQFVAWERPCRADGTTVHHRRLEPLAAKWPILPVVLEQYGWYVPVNASLAKMIRTYLALYAAERNPLDLAKARALGDACTRAQCHSGCIPTEWMGPIDKDVPCSNWINCQIATAAALERLAAVVGQALGACDPQTADVARVRADAKGVSAQGAFAVDIGTGLDAFVRSSVSLNGEWSYIVDQQDFGAAEFYKDLKQDGVKLVQHDFDAAPKMRVPTDWNSVDKTLLYYEGAMWLRRTFACVAKPGRRVVLRFGAVNYKADVWLNGKMLGSHEGGFTPFGFDVSAVLTNGLNSLVVRADSTRKAENIPCQAFDWWNYGGITRDVVLFDLPETYLAEGVLQCAKGKPEVLEGVVRASVPKAGLVATVAVPELGLRAEAKTDANGCARFTLSAKPELWSPESPRLYDVSFSCAGDTVKDRIGFRTVEVKGKKILLNGRQVFFKGVCFHDEKLGGGRVSTREDALPQLKLAKELGCNFLRLAHYPHNEATVREAERQGFMVWSEIPVYWNIRWENEATYANAERQLCDMVRRDANRAAVVVWSLANETPYGAPRDRFLSSLAKKARQLDATRIISMAMEIGDVKDHVCTITDTLNPYVDIVSFNQYVAWYWASAKEADEFTFRIPYDKPVVISEFGGGAVCGRHGPKDERWTEEYQAELYRANLAMLAKIDGLSGLTPWILYDFRSPRRPCPGIQDGYNRKGLVSERGEKKLAFEVMREFYGNLP